MRISRLRLQQPSKKVTITPNINGRGFNGQSAPYCQRRSFRFGFLGPIKAQNAMAARARIQETRFLMRKKERKWNILDEVLKGSWEMLSRGAADFNDPFHWPVLGSTGKEGVSLRCVILREFLMPERVLVCHSDVRARKVQEISVSAKVNWLFYHPQRKVQLRLSGNATLHADDQFADEQWAAVKATSRLNYCATEPPGTPVDSPSSGLPDFLLRKVPALFETEKGRRNFVAIACRIDSMDCLVLQILGNRRARFDWDETGMTAKWLIP